MTARDDGGPAFPSGLVSIGDGDHQAFSNGMTLRDWFAGQALAGLAANCTDAGLSTWLPDSIAARAYQYADAVIAERKGGAA
jgi:hypothetical protein